MRIIDLQPGAEDAISQVATLLVEGFAAHSPQAYPNLEAAVTDLEAYVGARGGLTITLGTDDENDQTSLSGINLYPNVWEHIARIRNLKSHPYEFYQKLGYVIVGVVPDANGIGKPDILMAKSVVQ